LERREEGKKLRRRESSYNVPAAREKEEARIIFLREGKGKPSASLNKPTEKGGNLMGASFWGKKERLLQGKKEEFNEEGGTG